MTDRINMAEGQIGVGGSIAAEVTQAEQQFASAARVSDDDLEYLGRILRRMPTDEGVQIGATHWSSEDLYSIVEEVMRARAAPVPEWFVENLRKKQRLCGKAMVDVNAVIADRALAQYQLLDEILQQAASGAPS